MNVYYDSKKSAELEKRLMETWDEINDEKRPAESIFNEYHPTTHGGEHHVYDVVYAVSDDTEILTPTGWKFINISTTGDEIFSLNQSIMKIEKDKILNIYYGEPKKRNLIHLSSRKIDQLISDNHRVLCKTRLWKGWSNFHYRLGEDIKTISSPIIIPCSYIQEDLSIEYPLNDGKILLSGWIISEGHFHKSIKEYYKDKTYICRDDRVDVGQRKKVHPEYYKEIETLLISLGYKYKGYADKIVIYSKYGREIRQFINEKRIPRDWINKFSNRQLNLLLSSMMKGDGAVNGRIYFSHDFVLLSQIQEVITRLGIKSELNEHLHYICFGNFGNPNTEQVSKKDIEEYNGAIYCLSTRNGNFIIRRNGKVSITGNCPMKKVNRVSGLEKTTTKSSAGAMFIGIVAQKLIQWLFTPEEREYEASVQDIIQGHLDIFEEKKYPIEIKASRMRIFKVEQMPHKWIDQAMCYMSMVSADTGWIVIVNLITSQITSFRIEVTQEDNYDTMDEMFRRVDAINEAINTRDHSKIEIQAEEYDNCNYKHSCDRRDECKSGFYGIKMDKKEKPLD